MFHSYTDEQRDIVGKSKELKGEQLFKIEALAGTGKTTTLIEVIRNNPNKIFLYLVFNRKNKEEMQKKLRDNNIRNADVHTIHSFAYIYIKSNNIMNKMTNYIKENLHVSLPKAVAIDRLFSRFCNSEAENFKTFIDNFYKESEPTEEDNEIIDLTEKFIKEMNESSVISYDFMLKKFHLNFDSFYVEKYDCVLLDEAQDTNQVTFSIIKKMVERYKNSFILVGDRHQSIYSWRGAENFMEKVEGDLNASLTTTFRIKNQNIIDIANEILTNYKNENKVLKIANTIKHNKDEKTFFLSRYNSTLIKKIDSLNDFNLIRDPNEIFKTVLDISNFISGNKSEISYENKFICGFSSLFKLEESAKKNNQTELLTAINIYKDFGKNKIFELYKKALNNKNKGSKYILGTAHSAKGLEADKVIKAGDFPTDRELKEIDEKERVEEINLRYIVVTRAKYEYYEYEEEEKYKEIKL